MMTIKALIQRAKVINDLINYGIRFLINLYDRMKWLKLWLLIFVFNKGIAQNYCYLKFENLHLKEQIYSGSVAINNQFYVPDSFVHKVEINDKGLDQIKYYLENGRTLKSVCQLMKDSIYTFRLNPCSYFELKAHHQKLGVFKVNAEMHPDTLIAEIGSRTIQLSKDTSKFMVAHESANCPNSPKYVNFGTKDYDGYTSEFTLSTRSFCFLHGEKILATYNRENSITFRLLGYLLETKSAYDFD
ncbi:MAG: hypothetical protein MRY83_12075 [Flavobacteriales bacterium]|nr:hypothetical protein [Flavobacteriales bacterium]